MNWIVFGAKAFAVIGVLVGIGLFAWACIRVNKDNQAGDL